MMQICTDDLDRHVLATTATLEQAFEAIEVLEALTATQLARNCEGATDFWLRLVVLENGHWVTFSAARIEPASAAREDTD